MGVPPWGPTSRLTSKRRQELSRRGGEGRERHLEGRPVRPVHEWQEVLAVLLGRLRITRRLRQRRRQDRSSARYSGLQERLNTARRLHMRLPPSRVALRNSPPTHQSSISVA